MEINKQYEPQKIEKKWYKFWEENGFFSPQIDKNKQPYTILMPPPNITGILHMGHVLNNTLQDVMIRYKRMTGLPTLWIPGTDHAGIATQNIVEKELYQKEGKTRHDIGREELIKRIWQWKEEKGNRIIEQLKQLGASCDWSRQRFTMDEGLSEAVKEVFIQLYEKGLIYKGKRIINWCPRCVTALANDEVEYMEESGHLWNMKYPLKDGSGFVTVATTRPETMLGDTAVAVNPNDQRYQKLIGKKVILPFVEREIPIIADEYVDMEFGSGCVKITPAHDPNDFEIGQRHDLEQILVIDENGVMNENAGSMFQGMDRFECRKKLIKELEDRKLLAGIEEHQHSVGHCYRCDTAIEPYLSDQWFVSMKPLAKRAIDVVKDGQVKFQPQRWVKVYLHWMENVRDWCISRQIWWGHRIPAYYTPQNQIVVAKNKQEALQKARQKYDENLQLEELRQDKDVLDTWFSSWLWPFSTMGWPQDTEEQEYFLPTNLLVTAPGIIYLWVARMIMSTLEFKDKIPFETVLLHGMVLDEQGRKMSKSLGNSPDPIHIIEEVGADALRFSMIFNTPKGEDSYYSEKILENGRNFANKIWNAFRFMMMNIEKIEGLPKPHELKLELADKWIYSRLQQVIANVTHYYEKLRLNDAAAALQEFIWNEFCAWYLELAKERIYDDSNREGQLTAKYILLDVLQNSMRLLHPIMPFITEEIFQVIKQYFPIAEDAIIVAKFPKADNKLIDKQTDADMQLIQEAISAIRNLRKQVNISPAVQVQTIIKVENNEQVALLNSYQNYFDKLAKTNDMQIAVQMQRPAKSIAAVVQNIEIYLPLSGVVDLEEEKNKLGKQQTQLEKELQKINGKLNNNKFLNNAPANIVTKEKAKQDEVETKLNKVKKILAGLE
ncbi:MAG: valyl-tRNA synthetase [Candidatus Cloacimonadota bacterium]|jgi:valyl-tRNA synthetase|nr:valyl-tRNA synthetase [Candidatus Cloacimonadota bacterium]